MLSVEPSDYVKLKDNLTQENSHFVSLRHPEYATVQAASAACYSGAFYALRKIDAMHKVGSGYNVLINSVNGQVDDGMTPFATATFIGVVYLTGRPDFVNDSELENWELVGCLIMD